MKVVSRFAALFFVLTCAWLALTGWFSAKREAQRAEERIRVDVVALADGLRAGVVLAWPDGGDSAARRIVEAANERHVAIESRWSSAFPQDAKPSLTVNEDGPRREVLYRLPVVVDPTSGGTLEVAHAIPSEGSLMRGALIEELVAALALGLITSGLALGLGNALIGQPLERIVAQARRIASGDLSTRLPEGRTDEIGHLKRELNIMCEKLLDARKRVEDESAARIETLEQLRHLDRLRTVGTLSSALAHELGTPFNVVLLRAQSLVDEDGTVEERRDASRVIVSQVERMSRTVRHLLDFSRAGEIEAGDVALRDLLGGVARLLGALAKKHGVELAVVVGSELVVQADRGRLEQVVTNLVMNAVQAMPSGGTVRLSVGREDSAIPPGKTSSVVAARIDVVDQGIGVPKELLARIFEPFFTTKPDGRGTGLGLSVASGIVEEHGGWLSAKSEEGHGATFSVYLPIPQ
jgi:signal transduction histidine kinase